MYNDLSLQFHFYSFYIYEAAQLLILEIEAAQLLILGIENLSRKEN